MSGCEIQAPPFLFPPPTPLSNLVAMAPTASFATPLYKSERARSASPPTTTAAPIAKKPRSLSHPEAAAIPLVALTAFACLDWLPEPSKSPNQDRRHVIVSGASGGVGIWCVQLAKKLYGCHVTAICSSRNADFVRDLGADEVIDYATQDVPQSLLSKRPQGNKFDLYVDCVGGTEMFEYWTQLLHRNGCHGG